jgi:hypothetical protein
MGAAEVGAPYSLTAEADCNRNQAVQRERDALIDCLEDEEKR